MLVRVALKRLMSVLGLEKSDAPGESDAEEQGKCQSQAVVGVEGNFGQ